MINEKVKPKNVCVLCAEIECTEHPELWRREFQCQICLFCHSTNSEAQSCCMDAVDKSVTPEHCYAPVSKRVAKPSEYYPTEAVKRAKGR